MDLERLDIYSGFLDNPIFNKCFENRDDFQFDQKIKAE